ncbi:unnamed protein product [marine sediment metagenome]|uniref:Lipopolysaccharide biosynthesis protein RfbH n=1 Tax=marine sediment metagenome TaxID=412755 RepID=X1TYY1_9ZZZZ
MKTEKEIRKEIFDKVKELYILRNNQEKFIPGKTNINYAGRVYDEKEMISLVDASLDFWLTSGRFAQQFEKEFAKFLGLKYCLLTNSGSSAKSFTTSIIVSWSSIDLLTDSFGRAQAFGLIVTSRNIDCAILKSL